MYYDPLQQTSRNMQLPHRDGFDLRLNTHVCTYYPEFPCVYPHQYHHPPPVLLPSSAADRRANLRGGRRLSDSDRQASLSRVSDVVSLVAAALDVLRRFGTEFKIQDNT